MRRLLTTALLLVALPAQAFFGIQAPPPECVGTPTTPYRVVNVDNPHEVCRTQVRGFLVIFLACTVNGAVATTNPRVQIPMRLVYMPKPENTDRYDELLRHEMGHVICPTWRH